jgi:hypothetical protein
MTLAYQASPSGSRRARKAVSAAIWRSVCSESLRHVVVRVGRGLHGLGFAQALAHQQQVKAVDGAHLAVGGHHAPGRFHQRLPVEQRGAGHAGQQVLEPGQAHGRAEFLHLARAGPGRC